MKIHMMGLGGAGMSALAKLLNGHGNFVTGCDLQKPHYDLENIECKIGHSPEHLTHENYDLLVCSTAIDPDNPEVAYAREHNIRIISRAQALSNLFNSKFGIGIAGTHGKTTTSSMTGLIFLNAQKNPTVYVGANVPDIGSNAISGSGEFFIAELDESDGSFELFHPNIAIITNADWDHVDHYKTRDDGIKAFTRFADNRAENGVLILCAEDDGANQVFEACEKNRGKIIRYGFGNGFDWGAFDINYKSGGGSVARISHDGVEVGILELNVSGEHNILNSLAAIAAAHECGIKFEISAQILRNFHGSERRMQIKGERAGVLVVDDYAHHPTEMMATLRAMKNAFPNRRIILVFQPHRFSRTAQFAREISQALSIADRAFVLPIYAASEKNISGITSQKIADLNSEKISCLEFDFENALYTLQSELKNGDILLTMGAGNVYELGEAFLDLNPDLNQNQESVF